MKLWFRKISVVVVTIMTLGMYVPPLLLNVDAEENKDSISSKESSNEGAVTTTEQVEVLEELEFTSYDAVFDNEYFIDVLAEKAREQSVTKLGPKIVKQVEDDFMEMILPNMQEVLKTVLTEVEEDELPYYSITEQPTRGFGEKIFHVYNFKTKEDIARFHVRRDNRPLEGYWFNFHYHLSNDNFEEHHEIGEIYWDKNVPPKWMA